MEPPEFYIGTPAIGARRAVADVGQQMVDTFQRESNAFVPGDASLVVGVIVALEVELHELSPAARLDGTAFALASLKRSRQAACFDEGTELDIGPLGALKVHAMGKLLYGLKP